jgi:hypothetical protein
MAGNDGKENAKPKVKFGMKIDENGNKHYSGNVSDCLRWFAENPQYTVQKFKVINSNDKSGKEEPWMLILEHYAE